MTPTPVYGNEVEQGNLEAKLEGGGVRRTWLVSIDSLHMFRDARQAAGELPDTYRAATEGADIAAQGLGGPIRELADRLAEEAAKAAEYRVRLELTERAESTIRAASERTPKSGRWPRAASWGPRSPLQLLTLSCEMTTRRT